MFQPLMSASAALRNQQTRLDKIANNVANINTTAFKSFRLDLTDSRYVDGITPGRARNPDANQQKGHGILIGGITMDFRGGNIQVTGIDLDFSLEGEGFFTVGKLGEDALYTRNGRFSLSVEADGTYLVNASGLYVLDPNGARIRVPDNTIKFDAGLDGTITFITSGPEENTTVDLGIFTFRNLTGLHSVGSSLFAAEESAGERMVPEGTVLRQGTLESSNVNLPEEVTRMIRTQRAFQLASRALTTADEMEGIANNMRR